jgi:hypothetical protein
VTGGDSQQGGVPGPLYSTDQVSDPTEHPSLFPRQTQESGIKESLSWGTQRTQDALCETRAPLERGHSAEIPVGQARTLVSPSWRGGYETGIKGVSTRQGCGGVRGDGSVGMRWGGSVGVRWDGSVRSVRWVGGAGWLCET